MVRELLENELTRDPKMVEVVDLLGKEVPEDSEEQKCLVEKVGVLGEKLLPLLGGSRGERNPDIGGPWNADLVDAFVRRAADPEVGLAGWLGFGCPAGVARKIASCGTFPPSSATEGLRAWADEQEEFVSPVELDENYASVAMEAELSSAQVDRLIPKGYAVKYDKWEDFVAAFGCALASKLACIVKSRDDGTLKVRNALDLRRSGYNRLVTVPERVVLPRLRDFIEDAKALTRNAGQ